METVSLGRPEPVYPVNTGRWAVETENTFGHRHKKNFYEAY